MTTIGAEKITCRIQAMVEKDVALVRRHNVEFLPDGGGSAGTDFMGRHERRCQNECRQPDTGQAAASGRLSVRERRAPGFSVATVVLHGRIRFVGFPSCPPA
jgi:hypothetical protein